MTSLRFLLAAFTALFAAVPLHAQSFDLPGLKPKKTKVTASLISEVTSAAPGQPFRVLVKLEHVPGAHTYGKVLAPEIIGKPTQLIWTLPDGWKMNELPWPAVHPFKSVDGSDSEGYEGTVHLPAQLTPPASAATGTKADLIVKVDALVCDDKTCTPFKQEVPFTVTLAAAAAKDPAQAALFPTDTSASASPPPGDQQKAPSGNAATPAAPSPSPVPAPAEKKAPEPVPSAPAATPAAVAPAVPRSFAFIMFSAFLGGLILNIMPCVFPVLGIKVVSVVQQAGNDRRQVVLHGLVYTLGILLSFWALGALVVALGKSWGFQLQSAGFTYSLAAFFLIFGMNMAGVFEIGASAVGVGSGLQAKHGLGGSFFSGLLATVVATPCSAPFLATALGATVKLPAPQAMLLFTLIGLGLAAPFLLLSAFPSLVSALPRPGAWMESFKQGMSFMLFGTVLFMLWVLTGMVDSGLPLLFLMLSLALIGLGCWIYGRWSLPHKPARTRTIAVALALVAVGGGLWLGWPPKKQKAHAAGATFEHGLEWQPWSESKVHELTAAAKPVYIDFTAKWCFTCQVNKHVYSDPQVQELFKSKGIEAVKADYTNEDPAIQAAFTALGRGAIPVNALYIPGQKDPLILPEILTVENVSEALRKIR